MRSLLCAAALLSLLVLAACGGGSDPSGTKEGAPQRGGDLTVLVPRADAAPDPHRVRTLAEAMIHSAVFRGLYVVPPTKEDEPETPDEPSQEGPAPDLAEGPPTVSEDGKVVTVRLRDGVRFGGDDGRTVNARDVARGIEEALADPVAGPGARRLLAAVAGVPAPGDPAKSSISGIEATDARTLVFRLRRPEARLVVAALSTPLSTPVPADRENISPWTGPYVPTQDGPDGQVVLVRNPAFRPLPDDWRRAYAERIRLEVDDSPGAASRVLNGERLVLGSTTVPASVATAATHRKQLTRVVMPATEYVGLNPTMPPFDRLDVRKAAIAAVDRQALLDAVRENGGILASHWLPPGTPGHDQAGGAEGPRYDWLARPEGDLAVAQAYLRRAGFADGRYEGRPIVAFTAGDHRSMVVAQAVRRRLALIGMDAPAARGARRGRARRVLGPRLGRGDLPRGRAVEPGPRPRGAAAPRLRRGAGLEPDGDRRPRRGHDARERHPARRAAGAGVGRHRTRRGRDRPGRALALGRAAAARVPRRARGRRRRLGRVGPGGDGAGARARRAADGADDVSRRRRRRPTGRTAARERSRSRDRRPRRSPATRRCRPARAG